MLIARHSFFGRAALFAALALIAAAGPVRADAIDDALMKNSAKILNKLRANGVQNVGILKFQVEKGKDAPSFFTGRLNTLMATRLENVLILANDLERPIGITRSAGTIAAERNKDAGYDSREGREKLFEGKYPLAWGKDEVAVDAFLTGLVKLSADYSKTTVIVSSFDSKNLEPRELLSVTVPTSRLMLADMNQKFFVTKRELNSLVPVDEKEPEKVAQAAKQVPAAMDKEAIKLVMLNESTPPEPKTDPLDKVLDFKVFYDGKEMQRGPDMKIASPKEGQKVVFKLKSTERLGVVLRVNGVNTSGGDTEERDANQYSMWVLQPGKLYTIDGFYHEDGSRYPFKVLAGSESVTYKLADENKRGKIELYVFRQVTVPVEAVNLPDVKFVSFRQPAPRMATAEAAQNQVLAMKGPSERKLIAQGENGGKVALNTVPFNNVELAGCMTITYFEAKR